MNKSAMQAENWLPWRKSSNAPGDRGRPECHCRSLWAMPAPQWACWSHSQPPITQQCSTITTFPITKCSPRRQRLVAGTFSQDTLAQSENTIISSASAIHFSNSRPPEGGGTVQVAPAMQRVWLAQTIHWCPSTGVWAAGRAGAGDSCIQLSLSSTHPWWMRLTHPVPFLTTTGAWLLVLSISKNRGSCLWLLQPLLPTSSLASDIYFLVGISFCFQWRSYARDFSDFNNLQIMSLK